MSFRYLEIDMTSSKNLPFKEGAEQNRIWGHIQIFNNLNKIKIF